MKAWQGVPSMDMVLELYLQERQDGWRRVTARRWPFEVILGHEGFLHENVGLRNGGAVKLQRLALIVHDEPSIVGQLETLLSEQDIQSQDARNCEEARRILGGDRRPDIIFTGASFADGTWRDVLAMGNGNGPRPAVVLTTRVEDMSVYVDAMEEGVFDYLVPPFSFSDVAWMIGKAGDHVFGDRKTSIARGV